MNRLSLTFLLWCLPAIAVADVCIAIEKDADRLACFDNGLRCVSISPDNNRLACFDRIYAIELGLNAQASDESRTSSAGSSASLRAGRARVGASEPETVATAPDAFGRRESHGVPKEYIQANIIEIETSPLKIDYLRLDNGHIWREVEDSGLRFRKGGKVTITEGVLNSFDLRLEGYNRTAKVRRIK